jgi:hypothetical protein
MKDGARQRVTPADAARTISSLVSKLAIRDLIPDETLAAIEWANKWGVPGAPK